MPQSKITTLFRFQEEAQKRMKPQNMGMQIDSRQQLARFRFSI